MEWHPWKSLIKNRTILRQYTLTVKEELEMNIHYPLYLLSKDCAEVERYPSFEELQGYLEPIDVENREFFCWDESETVFSLKVKENEKNWLDIAPADLTEKNELEEYRKAHPKITRMWELPPREPGKLVKAITKIFNMNPQR